jgi:hypothetical protein
MKKFSILFVFLLLGSQSIFAECNTTGITTFTQGGWGSKDTTNPAVQKRDAHFSQVFPSGATIGGIYTATFTSALAVQKYIPSGKSPSAFTENYIDPTTTSAGSFGGQVLSLYLNIKFNDAGYLGPTSLLGQLYITSGPLMGVTVNQLMNLCNIAIGGGSTPFSYSVLNTAATSVNQNFDNGIQGLGFLSCNNPLPVELSSFTSTVNGRNVSLIWETKTEINSNKFVIERINDAEWLEVGSVIASVLSNSPKYYSFTDKNLQSGKYQYRLKMIDNDGTFQYSSVIEAVIEVPNEYSLMQNYPNPFNPSTVINYSIPHDGKVTLKVFDITGRQAAVLVNEDQKAGTYSVNFDASRLSSGVYFYSLGSGSFTSVKKLMLMK